MVTSNVWHHLGRARRKSGIGSILHDADSQHRDWLAQLETLAWYREQLGSAALRVFS